MKACRCEIIHGPVKELKIVGIVKGQGTRRGVVRVESRQRGALDMQIVSSREWEATDETVLW